MKDIEALHKSLMAVEQAYKIINEQMQEVNSGLKVVSNGLKNHRCLVDHTDKLIDISKKVDVIIQQEKLIELIVGCDNILAEYLDASVLDNGIGIIRPTDTFLQYESDINKLSSTRLSTWPNGFYRNHDTKERQLLIVSEEYIYKFDGLPGIKYKLSVAYIGGNLYKDVEFREINRYLPYEHLEDIVSDLRESLDDIKSLYNF